MGKKHRNIRATINGLQNLILIRASAPDGIVATVDSILRDADEAAGGSEFFSVAIAAAIRWEKGQGQGQVAEGIHKLDDRTVLYMALECLDQHLARAGYPSWREIRDEWSDAVENG